MSGSSGILGFPQATRRIAGSNSVAWRAERRHQPDRDHKTPTLLPHKLETRHIVRAARGNGAHRRGEFRACGEAAWEFCDLDPAGGAAQRATLLSCSPQCAELLEGIRGCLSFRT